MNIFAPVPLFLALMLAALAEAPAAQKRAQFALHCLSPKVLPATVRNLGFDFRLEFTTFFDASAPSNGEFELADSSDPSSHRTVYRFYSPFTQQPIEGLMFINVPFEDVDKNFVPDFFETASGVNAKSNGIFDDGEGGTGNVTATWTRTAGSASGTCRMEMRSKFIDNTFTHVFNIFELIGPYDYTQSRTSVVGHVELSLTGTPGTKLGGAFEVVQINTNAVISLGSTWTNTARGSFLPLESDPLVRSGTNYTGLFLFQDFDLTTPVEDFDFWWAHFTDGNDSDADGIPDLSDPPPAPPPSLAIKLNRGQLSLSIQGSTGASYQIEKNLSVSKSSWQGAGGLTLTNDLHILGLGAATNPASFWRLKTP